MNLHSHTLKYPQIRSYTLITFTYSVCFWVYVSVFECMWVYLSVMSVFECSYIHSNTLNSLKYNEIHSNTMQYTQIHSNTLKYTQIHSNTLKYTYTDIHQIHSNTIMKLTYTHKDSWQSHKLMRLQPQVKRVSNFFILLELHGCVQNDVCLSFCIFLHQCRTQPFW